jgi:hypothetical protein
MVGMLEARFRLTLEFRYETYQVVGEKKNHTIETKTRNALRFRISGREIGFFDRVIANYKFLWRKIACSLIK